MQHYKTLYKNCKSDIICDPSKSEIVRYSDIDLHSYATLITLIGSAFMKAELYSFEKALSEPYHISVIVSPRAFEKYKAADADTSLERLEWLIRNMASPSCGAIVSIFINDNLLKHLDSPYCFNTLWHLETPWQGENSNYVTLQPHSEIDHNNGMSPHRIKIKESVEQIREILSKTDLDIIEMDYTTPIESVASLLLGSKAHFSYVGSTGYMSALIRTPTLYFGKNYSTQTIKPPRFKEPWNLPFDIKKDWFKSREYDPVTIPRIIWNSVGTPEGRTLMFNRDNGWVYHNEPEYYDIAFESNEINMKTIKIIS